MNVTCPKSVAASGVSAAGATRPVRADRPERPGFRLAGMYPRAEFADLVHATRLRRPSDASLFRETQIRRRRVIGGR